MTALLPITPMAATLVREPFHRSGFVYEEKFDGWRMIALKDGSRVRLVCRRGVDHTARFAAVAHAVARLSPRTLILDGELCAFDAQLVSHIHLLDAGPEDLATPPVFIAFDAVHIRGRDLREPPLTHRRSALEDAVGGSDLVFHARRLNDNGLEAWNEVKRRGLEGLVAKRSDSRYLGGRTRDWVKVKTRREGRFVVVGVTIADGAPSGLLLAAREGRRLMWVGTVEWGVGRATSETVLARAVRVVVPPCEGAERRRDVMWLKPRVVVEVSYAELLLGRLRDPVLRAVAINAPRLPTSTPAARE